MIMQKWEYCAILDVTGAAFSDKIGTYYKNGIQFFTPTGVITRELNRTNRGFSEAIARLGEEGWEMSGCGTSGSGSHHIYFKRHIEDKAVTT
jgi:hypothetical protein